MQDKRYYRVQKEQSYNEMLEWYPIKQKLLEKPSLDRRLHAILVQETIKDTDEAMIQIMKEVEEKVNSRILQKFNLCLINHHI